MKREKIMIIVAIVISLAMLRCGSSGGGESSASTVSTPTTLILQAVLSGAQEVPAVSTAATGTGSVTVDTSTKTITGSVTTTGITGTSAHIHDGDIGSTGAIVVPLTETPEGSGIWVIPDGTTLTDAQIERLRAAGYYFNVHSSANPSGEIRGQIMSYAGNVQTIWTGFCTVCHTPGGVAPFLDLTEQNSYASLVNQPATQSAGTRVIPVDSTNSVLYKRITGDGLALMPQGGPALSANNQNIIKLWINTGAANN